MQDHDTMTKRALNALKKSIEHWRRLASGKTLANEGVGPTHCALCNEFLRSPNWCRGCPVMQRTKKATCDATPYGKADSAFHEHGAKSRSFRRAAHAELKFLESLLPSKPSKK